MSIANSAVSRRPPAFQLYASDLLASLPFQDATAAERGLLLTMLMRVWLDDVLPAEIPKLARRLQLDVDEVTRGYGPLISAHFITGVQHGQSVLICPDLCRQMDRHKEVVRKKSEGGRIGGRNTQAKYRRHASAEEVDTTSTRSSNASITRSRTAKAPELNRTELSRGEKTSKRSETDEEWLARYEGTETGGFEVEL